MIFRKGKKTVNDNISQDFRWQICYLMVDTLGKWEDSPYGPHNLSYSNINKRWDQLEDLLLREIGVPQLRSGYSSYERVQNFLLTSDQNEFLTTILAFLIVTKEYTTGHGQPIRMGIRYLDVPLESVIDRIHAIFKSHDFRFEIAESARGGFQAISIDSEYLHEEAISKPMKLLHDLDFRGPLEEFDDAIQALEKQEYDNAINEAQKAFESTMKAILQELGISFNPSWQAGKLIDASIKADVIPKSLGSLSGGIRTVLESGLPSIRNAPGAAHGAGRDPKLIEQSYARFAVNLCGSYIRFLIERYEEKK